MCHLNHAAMGIGVIGYLLVSPSPILSIFLFPSARLVAKAVKKIRNEPPMEAGATGCP